MFAAVIIGLTSLSGDTTAISIGIVAGAVLVALGFVARAMLGAIIGGIFVVTLIISARSEEHTSELQSRENLVCRLLLEKKNNQRDTVAALRLFVPRVPL